MRRRARVDAHGSVPHASQASQASISGKVALFGFLVAQFKVIMSRDAGSSTFFEQLQERLLSRLMRRRHRREQGSRVLDRA